MSKIKKVENQPKFPQVEDRVTQLWKEKNIFQKTLDERPDNDRYVFVDGPPFVTGMPHYGSLLPSIAKDVVPRYWTMKGKKVRRVFGWDCHGLPIEEKINKTFNLNGRKQIEEEFSVERYVHECRSFVEKCTTDWRWYIEKIGRWVDLDNAYYTMYPEFNESVIWAFKRIYEKGLIYKGKRTSMYSTDTCTPVSQFEVAMDPDNYKAVDDLSIFVKFALQNVDSVTELATVSAVEEGKQVYLVAWTTTPWTIPSNTAVGVNPEADYCLVEFEGEHLIVAKARLEYTFKTTQEHIGTSADKLVRILAEFKGLILEGLSYTPVYDFFVDQKNENDWKVYLYDGVTIEDGTGVLHIAPAFGEEDFNLGKKHGLSQHQDIDEEGNMVVGPWKGTYLRDASPLIAEDMREKGNLLRSEMYNHNLPFYRGKNPLIYMTQDAYFIDVQKIKQKTLELNQDINWVPEHIKTGRFAQTLETSPDWCISRNRYWATIMPLWKSEDGDEIVVGSFEEMMSYTDQITKKEENGKNVYYFGEKKMSLHRDVCDAIVLTKDGKTYTRVPEVLDCWLDSGSVPFAEYHYPFENKEIFDSSFPADFIVEYVGQVRAWFNVLLRVSTLVFDKVPFKNVICTGVLAGNDGRKMSKSFGNYPDPKEVLENIGGEALRLYMMGSPIMVGGDMSWSDEALNEQVKTVLIPLWNVYKYLSIYAELHNWTPETDTFTSNNALDIWLKSYMDKVTVDYATAMESYDLPSTVKLIQPCIDNISSWWIRRSRDRFVSGDREALQTLYSVLVQCIKTFAPQMPFITEEIYQNLVVNAGLANAKESIHLEFYPEVAKDSINTTLLAEMEVVRSVCSLGLNVRVENGLKIRQPLAKAYVVATNEAVSINTPELLDIIKDELNVKEIAMAQAPAGDKMLSKSDVNFTVTLDTELTPELREEGLLNEFVRQVQNLRKTSGLQMGEKAKIVYFTSSIEVRDMVDKYNEEIKSTVSASELSFADDVEEKSIKVDDKEVQVKITKE